MIHKSVFNWSGGKDSSLALFHILRDPTYSIESLLSTVNGGNSRLAMHGVRQELIEGQARSLKIPLFALQLPEMPSMDEYNSAMSETMNGYKAEGFTHSIFGDIFLEDLKDYRVNELNKIGFNAVFPLWKRDTQELVSEFIDLGFKAITVCVKDQILGEEFVGRIIDKEFVKDLPDGVDPCGEYGEFHSFVFDGPIFETPVSFEIGEKVLKRYKNPDPDNNDCRLSNESDPNKMGFWFCDLIPK
ncbi:MAG: diphthine--ammonia ligase [Balneola sp.]|nr:MAG: diphthine--ammonia ligase [Balneola sp.]